MVLIMVWRCPAGVFPWQQEKLLICVVFLTYKQYCREQPGNRNSCVSEWESNNSIVFSFKDTFLLCYMYFIHNSQVKSDLTSCFIQPLFGRSLFFFCLSFLSLPFLFDLFASFSCRAMWKIPVMRSEFRDLHALHLVWMKWSDKLITGLWQPQRPNFFLLLSEHLIYWQRYLQTKTTCLVSPIWLKFGKYSIISRCTKKASCSHGLNPTGTGFLVIYMSHTLKNCSKRIHQINFNFVIVI